MEEQKQGLLFDDQLMRDIGDRFEYLNEDPQTGPRVFFENAGGSLRLKESGARLISTAAFPDCPSRRHDRAVRLKEVIDKGIEDTRILFNAKDGDIIIDLTATKNMYRMVGTVMETVPPGNVVTTILEHPSVSDSMAYFAGATGRELRIAGCDLGTGGVDMDHLLSLIDRNTALLAFMAATNILGAILDVRTIVREARRINPEMFILVDYVQHAPHYLIDLEGLDVDGINIAPYKFFGQRGYSMAYISDRLKALPHPHILNGTHWQLGSPAPALYGDITTIMDYITWIGAHFTQSRDRRALCAAGMDHIHLHERALLHHILEGTAKEPGLRAVKNVVLPVDNKDLTKRDLIIAVAFSNIACPDAVSEYTKRGVIVFERMGDSHYSKNVMNALGIPGAIRVSPLHCHSLEDVDKFLAATRQIAAL